MEPVKHLPPPGGWPIVSNDPAIQAAYVEYREGGTPHLMADMLAFRQPPGVIGSDRAFLEGHCNGNQFEKNQLLGHAYAEDAKAAGVNTKGKVYLSSLAAFPGDPKAWVSGRDDAKRVIEERGWGCHGSINVKMREVAQPTGGGVADSLVNEHTARTLESTPEPVKNVAELREQVKENLTPYWAK
jgi:hypothetical protein